MLGLLWPLETTVLPRFIELLVSLREQVPLWWPVPEYSDYSCNYHHAGAAAGLDLCAGLAPVDSLD